jgi:hypothetical protein
MIFKVINMRNFLIILLFGLHSISFSQKGNPVCDTSAYIDKMLGSKLLAKIFINPMVSNVAQFYCPWLNGDVILSNGSKVKNELLRYNSLLDELLWLRKSDFSSGIVYKSTVDEFVLYNDQNVQIARFKKTKLRNWYDLDSSYLYLQVLSEGQISLYVQRRMLNIDKSTKELVVKDQYYIKRNGIYYNFIPSRMNLYRVMKEDKEKMRKIVRGSHLKVRQEAQLTDAIKKYNADYSDIKN